MQDGTEGIKRKKSVINEVNWGFSKSTIFVGFFFVCLYFSLKTNQRERKMRWFFLFLQKSNECDGSE